MSTLRTILQWFYLQNKCISYFEMTSLCRFSLRKFTVASSAIQFQNLARILFFVMPTVARISFPKYGDINSLVRQVWRPYQKSQRNCMIWNHVLLIEFLRQKCNSRSHLQQNEQHCFCAQIRKSAWPVIRKHNCFHFCCVATSPNKETHSGLFKML